MGTLFKGGYYIREDINQGNTVLKGNHCILNIRKVLVCQKMGMVLENKVILKFNLEKNAFYKKWTLQLIFMIYLYFFEKILLILDMEN